MKTRTGKALPKAEPSAPKKGTNIRVPHDSVNEQVVIAAVVVDADARAYLRTIPAASFFGEGHADIWSTLQELDRRKLNYDPATVRSIGGERVNVAYLEALLRERPAAPPNLRHHVSTMQWDRARIELAQGPLVELIEALQDARTDPATLRAFVRRMESGLGGYGSQQYLRSGLDVAREQDRILTKRRESGIPSYGFGIEQIDYYEDDHPEHGGRPRLIPGTAPGMMTVVTGRSGSGKSTMTARAVGGLADSGRKILWGCWEQGSGVSLEVLAALRLQYPRRDVTEGRFTKEEQRALYEEMERLAEYISFYEFKYEQRTGRDGNDRVLDTIQQVVNDSGCDIFVADLFRRALYEGDPDSEERSLYRMQAMTQELGCHSILVQQQKTKGENVRRDMRPSGENIKGSSEWFSVADQIIAWHRPGQWKEIPDDTLESLILKQRFGPWPLAVELEWDGEYGYVGKARSIAFPHERGDDPVVAGGNDDVSETFMSKGRSGGGKKRR